MISVCLDVSAIVYGRGVSRYTVNLAKALSQRRAIDLHLYGVAGSSYSHLTKAVSQLPIDRSRVELKQQKMSWHELLWRLGLQKPYSQLTPGTIFHSWDWLQPPLDPAFPLVSTVHDLAILKFPETAPHGVLIHHQRSWDKLRRANAHIIAVSEATKTDIVRLLGFESYRVHVVREALPQEIMRVTANMSEEEHEAVIARLNLSRPFILAVGTREKRKNFRRLIEAWQPLAKHFDLLIAGSDGNDGTETLSLPGLRLLGPVSDQELSVLYTECSVFAYPSLYEGFGLPILEAFQYGAPVLTADRGGTAEVAGNAAELVDPDSVESIRAGLNRILGESSEQQNVRLQRMVVRSHMFSWDQVGQEMENVYNQVWHEHHN